MFDDRSDPTIVGSSETYSTVEYVGYAGRLGKSLVAAAIGLLLLVAAIALLGWNEGRAVDSLRALAEARDGVVEAPADADAPDQAGRLVHLTGRLAAPGALADPALNLSVPGLLRLERAVEMYQWTETERKETHNELGGGSTTRTTTSYSKRWSALPIDSDRFKQPTRHGNPAMALRTRIVTATDAAIGGRGVASALVEGLQTFEAVPPPADPPQGYVARDGGLYRGDDPAEPAVGDLRIKFSGVSSQVVSLVAGLRGTVLEPFTTRGGYSVGLIEPGDHGAAAMIARQRGEEVATTWAVRLIGFILILVAFCLLFAPVRALAAVLPFLGTIVGGGVFLFACLLAIALTLTIIALAWLAVRPLLGVGLLAGAGAALLEFRYRRARRPAPPHFLPGR